jgi:hypothetical protein
MTGSDAADAGLNQRSGGPAEERVPAQNDDGHADSNISNGNFTHSAIGSITASGTATDRLAERPLAGRSGFDGDSGNDGDNTQVRDGQDGASGHNGNDGADGTGDGEPVVNIDIDNVLNVDLGDTDLGDVTNLITETVNDIVNITEVVNNITDITTDVTNNITDIVNTVIDAILPDSEGLTLALDGVVSDLTHLDLDLINGDTVMNLVDQTLDLTPVTDLTALLPGLGGGLPSLLDIHSIHDLLGGPGHEHLPSDTDLALGLDGALGNTDLVNGVTDVLFNPVEDLVGDIDIAGDLGLDLLGGSETSNAVGDTDITLGLGLDLADTGLSDGGIHIPLDAVETITGDIDLDLGVATDLLGDTADGLVDGFAGGTGTDGLLPGVGDALGDLTNDLPIPGGGTDADGGSGLQIDFVDSDIVDLDIDAPLDNVMPVFGNGTPEINVGMELLGSGETDNGAGDTDISIGLDASVAGIEVPDIQIDIPLDPVEQIVGDIDLDIGAAIDILNETPDTGILGDLPLPSGVTGDADTGGIGAWTENALPDLTGGDLAGDLLGGVSEPVLPDPVGGVAEGLGGLLGGQGGSHGDHLGGLFG